MPNRAESARREAGNPRRNSVGISETWIILGIVRMTLIAVAVAAGLVSACTWQASQSPATVETVPAGFPEQHYRQAAARGQPVFLVDPVSSLVVIEVRRGGSLAHLGHDHVVAGHDVEGFVAPGEGRADLYLRLERLVVDEPGLRAEAKLDTEPTADDVVATRRNMLKSLRAEQHPFVVIHIASGAAGTRGPGPSVAITLNGTTRTTQVPMQIDASGDDVHVTGRMSLRQTDFGIEPMSVLGGAIQVQDVVELRFRIHAHRFRG